MHSLQVSLDAKKVFSFLDSGEALCEVSFEVAVVGRMKESERFRWQSNFQQTKMIHCRNMTGYQMWPRIEGIDRRNCHNRQICLKVFVAESVSNSLRHGVWTTHYCEELMLLLWPPSLPFLLDTVINCDF